MNCYICRSTEFTQRKGKVRDASNMQIVECDSCGLVTLNTTDHISPGFYEKSGMHGEEPIPMDVWLKETERDDERRFDMVKAILPNKRLLDFGCGAAGFLLRARNLAADVTGIELESRVREYWAGQIKILPDVEAAGVGYDLITAFHVLEHLPEARSVLASLAGLLKTRGRIIIEVPNANDALLTLYDCDAFQRFTYWSLHRYLFNASTLEILSRQAGFRVVAVEHYQRYPLSNHVHWLSRGEPGGHERWAFLDTPNLTAAYGNVLAALGKTDTLIAHLELRD